MNYTTQQLKKWDAEHLLHPYMNFEKFRNIIAKGEGAYIYDHDGKKYLDGVAGLWCVNIGHGRKELGEVMQKQTEKLGYYSSFVSFANEPSILLAQKIMALAPKNLTHLYFTTGGSEANDATIRIVHNYNFLRKMPYKKHIISRKQAYHGMTYLTASLTGLPSNNENYHTITDFIHHLSCPSSYRPPMDGELTPKEQVNFYVTELEKKIHQLGAHNVAAFIAEPIMGAGGVHVAPEGYHKKMWEVCKKHDILYVSDEVVTGFCRLGEFFTTEKLYGVKADIINVAKGITSGYFPMGATLISDEIYSTLKKGEFTTAFTYSAHPVGAAVALKNIEIMEKEKIGEGVKTISQKLWQRLKDLQKKHPVLGDVRGSHFMLGFEFVADQKTKKPFPLEKKFSAKLSDFCFENGLVIRPLSENINVLSPTLIWKEEQVEELYKILDLSITQTLNALA